MNCKYYEQKINDVILKCPIEAGVEILVYNMLDNIVDSKEFSLVDINSLLKGRDERLTTDSGISDIAVLSSNFEYKTDIGEVYGFIEVKSTYTPVSETKQIEGQKKKVNHYLYTNGLVWNYFKNGNHEWEVELAFLENKKIRTVHSQAISINKDKYNDLIENISKIKWKE